MASQSTLHQGAYEMDMFESNVSYSLILRRTLESSGRCVSVLGTKERSPIVSTNLGVAHIVLALPTGRRESYAMFATTD